MDLIFDTRKDAANSPQAEKKKKDFINKTTINAGLSGAQSEIVKHFGEANKQHFMAYSGADREAGRQLSKGLKSIAESKVNPDYRDTNLKQQAGFSAEVKTTARENAEKIIRGGKGTKATRTDDMQKAKQPDGKGNTIGGKNDRLYDIAEVDGRTGVYIEGTARQLKFVGGTPKECSAKLLQAKYDKYRQADVPIEVPSDFYDDVKKELSDKANTLKDQMKNAENKGDATLAEKKKAELERVEQTSKNLKKGKLTKQEAIEARLHPKLSTAKDIAGISHKAGLQAAKNGVLIGGGMSFIRNAVAVIKGDQDPQKAAVEITKDTAGAGVLSYSTGFIGSALKGCMQNAPSDYVRCISKTNLPGSLVTIAVESGKTLKQYADGEIEGAACLTQLGEKGTGMLASSMGAVVGGLAIPVPVVGGFLGGMIGYALASAYYHNLVTALDEAKIAHEERLQIEEECREAVIALKEYRLEMELVISNYLRQHMEVFREAFVDMEIAYNTGDADGFIAGTNQITRQLGGELLFESKEQFDALMSSKDIIRI